MITVRAAGAAGQVAGALRWLRFAPFRARSRSARRARRIRRRWTRNEQQQDDASPQGVRLSLSKRFVAPHAVPIALY